MDYRSENPPGCGQCDLCQLFVRHVPNLSHHASRQSASEGRGSRSRMAKAHLWPYHQHDQEVASKPSKHRGFPTGHQSCIEPVHFRDTETNDSACVHSLQRRTHGLDAPGLKTERRRSFGATLSFSHGRNRLGSRSSTPSTNGMVEHRPADTRIRIGVGPCCPKEKADATQTSTTHHSAGSYFPNVRPGLPLASNNDPIAPADVVPPYPPTLAPSGYRQAQMKNVLKHAREALMKEIRKVGHNDLVVERVSLLVCSFLETVVLIWHFGTRWGLTVLCQSERYRIKVVYRARPAVPLSECLKNVETHVTLVITLI